MPDSNAITELANYAEQQCETFGTDNYSIELSSEAVAVHTLNFLKSVYGFCGERIGAVVAWHATQHNRSYGDCQRYTINIVLSVPVQKEQTRISRKDRTGNGAALRGHQMQIPGTGSEVGPGDNGTGLTEPQGDAIVVRQGSDDEGVAPKPSKRR